jgi:hypothetical protein
MKAGQFLPEPNEAVLCQKDSSLARAETQQLADPGWQQRRQEKY